MKTSQKSSRPFLLRTAIIAIAIHLSFSNSTVYSQDDYECGVSNAVAVEYLQSRGYDVITVSNYKSCDRIAPTFNGHVIVHVANERITGHENVNW